MTKTILSVILISFPGINCFGASLTWNGKGGNGQWSDAANWVGNILPQPGDDVTLDNSSVGGNYTVTLPSGTSSVSISSLVITPLGNSTIIFIIPNTNTSAAAFTVTGSGDAVVLNNGAVFINSCATGMPITINGTGFFRINNGGRYIHRTNRSHTSLLNSLSMAAGTEKGIFEFDVPAASFTISLAGRTYGTLVLSSATNGNAVTYSGNGANSLHINGDLQINPGTRFSIGMSADMIVQGKLILSASSEINLQNSTNNNLVKIAGDINADGTITETNSGLPVLELNGTKMQNVSVSGSVVNNVSFRVNNPAGTTLTTPLTLPYKLELMTGKIRTNEINILSLADNAIVTGGSTVSFVDGPMKKIGDDNFTFPVGKGSIYAPVGYISTGLATTDVFQAEYFRSSPQSIYGINYQAPPIHHVSYAEYWSLNKITGNLNIPAKITLTVNEYSFATDINTLLVARFDGVDKQWKSDNLDTKTPGIYNPPYVTGTLTSDPVSSFGIFTLATSVPEAINPLPIKLISFSVEKISDHKSIISWRLADCVSDHVGFELQRSVNANEFITIKNMTGRITDHYYTFIDDQLPRGLKNYRLRITNEDGKISFSKVVALPDSQRGLLVNIYPNPVSDKSVIEIHSDTVEQIRFVLHDVSGRMVKAWNERIHAGMTLLHLSVVDIGKGIYFLSVLNSKAETTTPFIKQ